MSPHLFFGSTPAFLICDKCGDRKTVTLDRRSRLNSFELTTDAGEKCFCGGALVLINSAAGQMLAAKFQEKE